MPYPPRGPPHVPTHVRYPCVLLTCPAGPQARRGGLKDTSGDDLLATVFEAIVRRTGVEPAAFGDIVIGSVLGSSAKRATEVRIAGFFAGYPDTVTVRTVNRCAGRSGVGGSLGRAKYTLVHLVGLVNLVGLHVALTRCTPQVLLRTGTLCRPTSMGYLSCQLHMPRIALPWEGLGVSWSTVGGSPSHIRTWVKQPISTQWWDFPHFDELGRIGVTVE